MRKDNNENIQVEKQNQEKLLAEIYQKKTREYTTEDVALLCELDADYLVQDIINYTKAFLIKNTYGYAFDDVENALVWYVWREIKKFNSNRSNFSTWCYMVLAAALDHEDRWNNCQKRNTKNVYSLDVVDPTDRSEQRTCVEKVVDKSTQLNEKEELLQHMFNTVKNLAEKNDRDYIYLYHYLLRISTSETLKQFPLTAAGRPNSKQMISVRAAKALKSLCREYKITPSEELMRRSNFYRTSKKTT